MGGPLVTLRCPRCGGFFSATSPPSSSPGWVVCPHCGRPAPVLAPRDPAPLFTWEAFPQLYPSLARPRVLTTGFVRIAGLLLVAVAALLLVSAAGYLFEGAQALPARSYTVGGHVLTNSSEPLGSRALWVPLAGATVRVTGEDRFRAVTTTDASGSFRVGGVPAGGITLNVTDPGFAPFQVGIFASAPYSDPAAGPGNLTVEILPGGPPEGSTLEVAPFYDLENYLATLWSTTTVLGGAAVLAAVSVPLTLRGRRLAFGVAGGAAGALAPAALYEIGLIGIFPQWEYPAEAAAVLGVAASVLLAAVLASTGAPEPADRLP